MSDYRSEFPDFPAEDMPQLPAGRQLRDGPARETRDDAARALFDQFPSLRQCSTARAYQDGAGTWRTAGSDSRAAYRHKLEG